MEEKRKLTSNDKIPGCERLTRPEEIKSLSKYLGAIRETQEEWISNNMPSESDQMVGREPDIELSKDSLRLERKEEEEINLPESNVLLEVKNKVNSLNDGSEKLNLTAEEPGLSKGAEKLSVPDVGSLRSGLENLEVPDIKGLREGIEKINPSEVDNLKDKLIRLKAEGDLKTLPDKKEGLNDDRKEKLNPILESLHVSDINKLDSTREGLHVSDINDLATKSERLKNISDPDKLSTVKEGLNVSDVKELGETKQTLVIDDIESLPESQIILTPNNEPQKLSNFLDALSIDDTDSLPDAVVIPTGDPKDSIDLKEDIVKLGIPKSTLSDLPKGKETLTDNREESLRPGKKGLRVPDNINGLKNDSIGLEVEETNILSDQREGLEVNDPANKLGDSKETLKVEETESLRGKKESLKVTDKVSSLPAEAKELEVKDSAVPGNKVEKIYVSNKPELGKEKIKIHPTTETSLSNEKETLDVAEENSLREKTIKPSVDFDFLSDPQIPVTVDEKRATLKPITPPADDNLMKKKIEPEIDFNTLAKLSADDLYEILIDNLGKKRETPSGQDLRLGGETELAGILSAYLSGKSAGPVAASKIVEFFQKQALVDRAANTPDVKIGQSGPDRVGYKLPDNGFTIDQNRYIRNLAELAADATAKNDPWGRKFILDSTLMALITARRVEEVALKANRDRLPGKEEEDRGETLKNIAGAVLNGQIQSVVETVKRGTLNSVVKATETVYDVLGPDGSQNRPTRDEDGKVVMGKSGEIFKNTYNIQDATSITTIDRAKVQSAISSIFGNDVGLQEMELGTITNPLNLKLDNIFKTVSNAQDLGKYDTLYGIGLTLHDLCGTSVDSVDSVEKLYDKLTKSPYITSAQRVILDKNRPKMTLDSNAYWEVILEPLCPGSGYQEDIDKNVNGGWSFLPSIFEINCENKVEHGVNTKYSNWVPINGIELSKSRLTSKTTGLYDGEISFPVSVEFTNELRLTVVDDQYKSWRRYFQKCTDVSVYNSEGHTSEWYKQYRATGDFMQRPTAIDKTKFCAAFYKNVAFRIRIYFMTPQYSTIKKYDLLCVLKDFSEEYTGDIEGGGIDLNVSFSIVGEDPTHNSIVYQEAQGDYNVYSVDRSQPQTKSVDNYLTKAVNLSLPGPGIFGPNK